MRRLCHIACSSRCVDQKRKGLHEHLLEKRLHWSVSRREEQLARIDLGETVPFDIALPLPARDERPGSDSGVRLFWERFTCQRCGRCCYTPGAGLYLEEEEFERIAGFLGSKRRLKALCRRDGATGAWILRQPCPFYDEGLRACRIYEIRPATCAKYPLHPPLEDMPYNLAVDAFCPAARSFVKETLGWWIICEDNWARLLAMSGP
ncbi:MAG: YkgJ family cysteine cluster protein [Methanothrix sp.]|nr:YkgJ family cysteine cluster protein [Methanothrix sp.]